MIFPLRNVLLSAVVLAMPLGQVGAKEEAPLRIPLKFATENDRFRDEMLFVGVPFPKGMLAPGASVVVVDREGKAMPTASRVMANWPQSDSVRWLGVDFQGSAKGEYFLVSGQPPEGGAKVEIQEEGEQYRVHTGAAQFVISKSGSLISEAGRLEGGQYHPVLKGSALYVTDQQGNEALAGQESSIERLKLETASPIKATFRREGWYVTAEGRRVARHLTRLHFTAGRAQCRIEHSLIVTEPTDQVWFRDYGLRFHYAQGSVPQQIVFPRNDRANGEEWEIPFDAKTAEVFLLQERAFQFSRMDEERDCAFQVGKTTVGGESETLHSGTLAGDWMKSRSATGSLALAVRGLWQTYPKELRSTPEMAEVRLWSARGGAELDFRMDTIRKQLPEEWLNDEVTPRWVIEDLKKTERNAQGVARTHEILLDLAPAGDGAQQTRLEAFSGKIVMVASPEWLRHSEAMGRFHPYDPQRFPLEESFMEGFFDQQMEIYNQWGEYGFFQYGAGPHVWFARSKGGPLAGRWLPSLQRYPLDYGFHSHVWRMFARSGKRKYFDAADRMTRFRLDLGMVHWPSARKMRGTYQATSTGPVAWSSTSMFHMQSGTDLRSLAYLYYLTDYRPAFEMLKHYGWAVKMVWNAADKSPLRGTRPFASLKNIATVYQETGDPELKKIVEEQTRWLADLNAPQGVAENRELTRLGKYGVKSGAMQRVAEVLNDEVAAQSVIKGATTIAMAPTAHLPFAYYNSQGEQVSEAYYRTGDPLFIRSLARDMAYAISYYRDGEGWKPLRPERGPCSALSVYALGGMAFAMDAVAHYEKQAQHPVPAVPFARQAGQGRKVVAVFEKPAGRAVVIDVRSLHALSPRVVTLEGKEVQGVRQEAFTDQLNSHVKAPTRYLLTLPAETAAGAYVLDPGVGGAPWEVNWTDAPKLVLFAPGGLVAGSGDRSWGNRLMIATPDAAVWQYFKVPEGVTSFTLSASGPLELLQPDGKEVALSNLSMEATEIAVPEGLDGKLWAFRATAPRFVRFAGVPPFFAYGDAERYLNPGEPDEVEKAITALGLRFPDLEEVPAPDAAYGPEETAFAGLSGVALVKGRHIRIPEASTLIRPDQGTLECWLKPFRSSITQFADKGAGPRVILTAGPWEILLHRSGEMSVTAIAKPDAESKSQSAVEGNAGAVLEPDRWTHVAFQWSGGGKDFQWKIFVDGRQTGVGLATQSDADEDPKEAFLPASPGDEVTVGADRNGRRSLNALMAGLRFSSVGRYDRSFTPSPSESTRVDAATLGFFPFHQTALGTGANQRPLQGILH